MDSRASQVTHASSERSAASPAATPSPAPPGGVGVVRKTVLPSGVSISVLFPGDDVHRPQKGNFVRVHYEVRLLNPDGGLSPHFDSSRTRGVPYDFQLGAGFAVAGVEEALLHMSRGERALIAVPSSRGYGAIGCAPFVPPHAILVYDLDLISIQG